MSRNFAQVVIDLKLCIEKKNAQVTFHLVSKKVSSL